MNLARHAAVLWRFRAVTAAGLILGLTLAILASYKVSLGGHPALQARGSSTYNAESQIMVTQPGFPEGRVVLPESPELGTGAVDTKTKVDPDRIEYADPARFLALTDLYTQLLTSDEVRSRIPGHPKAAQITASPLPATSGAPILPIIDLITTDPTAEGAHALNVNAFKALKEVLSEQQARAHIVPAQRIELSVLKEPKAGALVAGPSRTGSILALLLAMIGTVAVTHLLAALRGEPAAKKSKRASEAPAEEAESDDALVPAFENEASKRLAAVQGGNAASASARGGRGYWGAR